VSMLDEWDWQSNKLGDVLCGLDDLVCVDVVVFAGGYFFVRSAGCYIFSDARVEL